MAFRPLIWAASGRGARMGFLAALLVPAALCVTFLLFPAAAVDSVRAVLFVSGLIAVATLTTLPAAVMSAVASFVAFQVTGGAYLAPLHWHGSDVFLLAAFLGISVMVARRASRTRQEVEAIRLGGKHETARRELTAVLSAQESEIELGKAAVQCLESILGLHVALWLGERGYVREGPAPHLSVASPGPNGVAKGEAGWQWLPFQNLEGLDGAVGLRLPPGETLQASMVGLVRSLSADIAHMVQRSRLANDLQKERAANESERLCTALLASVAHDLKTPLATIMASSETLRAYSGAMSASDCEGLLENIESEGRRLDHYIQNLVDVTQISEGKLETEPDRVGAEELIGSAITRLKRYHRDARIVVRIDPELPMLRVHGPLLEQAIYNLLHNAAKFSPPDRPIVVTVGRAEGGEVILDVEDEGPGIPRAERELVFDMFYSADRGDMDRSGTGLGLAISQSIVRAHGGEVRADQRESGQGTMMRIQLPPTAAEGACP